MNGILLVDKPEGMTSNDVVQMVKRLVKPRKVGHSGTLDPAASGLITIAIGAATRALEFLDESRKTYTMTIRLGEETDTCDREGAILSQTDPSLIELEHIEETLGRYRGRITQIPPHFSAIKHCGVPLYKLARKGIFPDLTDRSVEIFSLELLSWLVPLLSLSMVCSKGTYARAVARDLGRDLGVGGRLQSLRRVRSGPLHIEQALPMHEISSQGKEVVTNHLMPLIHVLTHIPTLHVTQEEVERLVHGNSLLLVSQEEEACGITGDCPHHFLKAVSANGDFLIFLEMEAQENVVRVKPRKVLDLRE
jgi:tRNA pseudouridine55 synthase